MTASMAGGERVGPYRILHKIGEGGMGEVYAAEDERLGRRVALKVLPRALAVDPERRARFEREAKAVAALNHPHIVTIHAVEEVAGQLVIVMELVAGKTLAELVPERGFTPDDFFRYALPLAEAVGAAHAQGITHRDLKPQNVMISDDGRLKVLDFGLAKVDESAGFAAAQSTATATAEGRIVGTVAYMSPEQAQGKKVDHRSDVFSLGVVLFEMATGRRPFAGDSNITLITAILRDVPPSVTEINGQMPRGVARVVRRCLAKNPAERYQSALDIRHDLEDWREDLRSGSLTGPVVRAPAPGARRWAIPAVAVVIVAVLGAFALVARKPASAAAATGPRITALQPLTTEEGAELFPSLAPDGTWFAYARRNAKGRFDIYRKRVGGENAQDLTADCAEDDIEPAISPDGERIAFRSECGGGGVFVVGATGESVRRLADFGYHPSWSPDGKSLAVGTVQIEDPHIIQHGLSEIWLIDVASGDKRKLVDRPAMQPSFSPHGLRIVYFQTHRGGQRDLLTVAASGGAPVQLTDDPAIDWAPVWSPDGRYVYFSSNRSGAFNLWRIGIDEATGQKRGDPEPVTVGAGLWLQGVSFARTGGRALLDLGRVSYVIERARLDGSTPAAPWERFALGDEPDVFGDLMVYRVMSPREDLVVQRLDGSGRRRLTDDAPRDRLARFSPDGKWIVFKSDRDGSYQCWIIGPDGNGLKRATHFVEAPVVVNFCGWRDAHHVSAFMDDGKTLLVDIERIDDKPVLAPVPAAPSGVLFQGSGWSADGRTLVGHSIDPAGHTDVWAFDTGGKARRLAKDGWEPLFAGAGKIVFGKLDGLWTLDLASDALRPVANDPLHEVGNLGVDREGRFAYFQRRIWTGELWLATVEER